MAFEVVTIGDCTLYLGDALEVLPSVATSALCLMDPPYELKHVDGGGFAAARQFYRGGALKGIDSFDLQRFADVLSQASDQFVAFHSRDQIRDWAEFAATRFGKYDLHVWHKTNAIPFTCNTWKSDLEYIALGWRIKRHQEVEQYLKNKAWISSLCTDTFHPTCKPVPLMEKYILVLTAGGDVVCDPFMGSGTTGVACIRTERRFVGVELDERHFETACRRIEQAWQAKRSEIKWPEPKPPKQLELI